MIRPRTATFAAAFVALCLCGFAQTKARTHTLQAKIEGINEFAHTLQVYQEKIPGYSDARAATYNVDDPKIIETLSVGDRFAATIYEGGDTLFDIRVARIDDRVRPFGSKK